METDSKVLPAGYPGAIHKSFGAWCWYGARVGFEMVLAATVYAGIVLSPLLFNSGPRTNYEHAVFLPIVEQANEMHGSGHFLMPLIAVIGTAFGFFGRAPVLLIGPAFVTPMVVWIFLDVRAGGGGHNLLPFELLAYFVGALLFMLLALIGRLARRWLAMRR